MRAHGTRACYVFGPEPGRGQGCHCEACRRANTEYALFDQKRARLNGTEGRFARPYVDAAPARAHLLDLQAAGVGRRTIADRARVAPSVIVRIRNGDIRRVRPATRVAILAVGGDVAGGQLVDATSTWELIEQLLASGVTKCQIGQAVAGNPAARSLQLRRDRITQRSADRVAEFARAVLVGPEPGTVEHFRWWREQQRRTA